MALVDTFGGVGRSPEALPGEPRDYELGYITNIEEVTPSTIGITAENSPRAIRLYHIQDPYLSLLEERCPQVVEEIRAAEWVMSAFAEERRRAGDWQREPGAYVDDNGQRRVKRWGDPLSQRMFLEYKNGYLNDPGIRAWRSTIPHAASLLPLAKPSNLEFVFNRRGEIVEATENTRNWMTVCTDAQAIRNRGTILAEEVKEAIVLNQLERPEEKIIMVSVGAGTLLPTLQAAVNSGVDSNIKIVMMEKDPIAIGMARQLAEELGFKGEVETREIDVFDPDAMEAAVQEFEGKAVSVDAVGLYEYIRPRDEAVAAGKFPPGYLLNEPVKFMSLINRMVGDGGRLVVGQMRDDRPVPDFTMGVIGWPEVIMRSPNELMGLIREAGIDLRHTSLSLTPEGVYTMATISKPRGTEPTHGFRRDWRELDRKPGRTEGRLHRMLAALFGLADR